MTSGEAGDAISRPRIQRVVNRAGTEVDCGDSPLIPVRQSISCIINELLLFELHSGSGVLGRTVNVSNDPFS